MLRKRCWLFLKLHQTPLQTWATGLRDMKSRAVQWLPSAAHS